MYPKHYYRLLTLLAVLKSLAPAAFAGIPSNRRLSHHGVVVAFWPSVHLICIEINIF
jgi:hypothetical protein